MAEKKPSIWSRIFRQFRAPTFHDYLEDSVADLHQKPVTMNCPQCGEMVPFSDRCPKCGSPWHPPIDERV